MSTSTFLDGRPYTQLRGAAWLFLSDTGQVLAGSITGDSGGGGTLTWGTAVADIPCRVETMSGSEREIADRVADNSTHLITVPPGTAATHADRFLCTAGTFEITAVRTQTREWLRTLEAVQVS